MQSKELSIQQANELCIKALVLLVQQNQTLRHKKSKAPLKVDIASKKLCDSPKKTSSTLTKHELPEEAFPELEMTHHQSPSKKTERSWRKSSLPNSLLHKEIEDAYAQSQPLLPLRQHRQISYEEITLSHSSIDEKIQMKMEVEEDHKGPEGILVPEEKFVSESQLKDLKRDLEIKSKGKICKTQQIDPDTHQITGYHFYCKNDSECPFHCFLACTSRTNSKGQQIYKFESYCEDHLKDCLEDAQQITFLKLTKLIDSMEPQIRGKLGLQNELKPKDILSWMANQLGESDHRFIYSGLSCKNYHKAAKKYFDNLIYKIKNPLSL